MILGINTTGKLAKKREDGAVFALRQVVEEF